MLLPSVASWHEGAKCWSSAIGEIGENGRRRPVYFRDIPFGAKGNANHRKAQDEFRKYPEARDAFVKLQAASPNDARVWYLAAIANGFATGVWVGETEKMVNTGLDKEKAGQPSSGRVDSTVAFLTPATGKSWLADYRKRITPSR